MLFVQNSNGDQTAFKADNVQITDTLGQYPTLSLHLSKLQKMKLQLK